MKIFLSHVSRDKSTVEKFRSGLPPSIKSWLDIEQIEWGGSLAKQLESAIKTEVDYLLVFLAPDSLNSRSVQEELGWAFEREKQLRRTFVLPIVLEEDANKSLPAELRDRLYLPLASYDPKDIEVLAERATGKLFELIVEEYRRTRQQIVAAPQLRDVVEQALRGGYDKRNFWTRPMLRLPPQNSADVYLVFDAAREVARDALLEARPKVNADKVLVRANVFLPTSDRIFSGDVCTLRIPEIDEDRTLQRGMEGEKYARERSIRFRPSVGAKGRVFVEQRAVGALTSPKWFEELKKQRPASVERWEYVDLHPNPQPIHTDSGRAPFRMTEYLNKKVDDEVAWIISMPIILRIQDRPAVVGVFNIDCCGIDHQVTAHELRAIFYRLVPFAGALSGILRGSRYDRIAIFALRN